MYHHLPDKNRQVDFYKGGGAEERDMIIDVSSNGELPSHHHHLQQQMVLGDNSSGGEDHEMKAPKKRAETWVQEETLSLISFRREVDGLFNTSKSNKHLWEQISSKMREKGFDRSATMCTDKWRNLLKEYKKAKHHDRSSASAKMSYYKELEELINIRHKSGQYKSPNSSKVDFYIQFSDKGLEESNIAFASIEGPPATVGIERSLDHDPLTIASADTVAPNGVPPWNWREAPGNGGDHPSPSHCERLISVKWGDEVKKIAVDGTAEAIESAIRFAFLIRTDKIIWLENENNAVQSLDKNMPLREYILHVDEGKSIKLCVADESGRMVMHTEEVTLYSSEEFRSFLTEHGFTGLKELNGFRLIRNLDDLQPGAVYQGAKVRFMVGS